MYREYGPHRNGAYRIHGYNGGNWGDGADWHRTNGQYWHNWSNGSDRAYRHRAKWHDRTNR